MRPSVQYRELLLDYIASTKEHDGGLCRFLADRVNEEEFNVHRAWAIIRRLARCGDASGPSALHVRDWPSMWWLNWPGRTPERVALAASIVHVLEDPEVATLFDAELIGAVQAVIDAPPTVVATTDDSAE